MQTTIKMLRQLGLVLMISFCLTTIVNAQTPDDDPGIGGPGSGNNTPGDDGGPIVPFDGGMSLVLLASGIAYGALNNRGNARNKDGFYHSFI